MASKRKRPTKRRARTTTRKKTASPTAKVPGQRGRPAKRKAVVEFKEGLPSGTNIKTIKLSDIDHEDTRFQFRLTTTIGDLRKSLQSEGQQVPIVLFGEAAPYVIIDGFRRVEALAEIGWEKVKAIVRDDINEDEAFALSFVENVKRKSYSPWDKANAIWQAVNQRKMTKDKVAEELGLSVRQVERYLKLLDLDRVLQSAVQNDAISMAHAAVLHQAGVKNSAEWVKRAAEESLSAKQLKKLVKKTARTGRPKKYVQQQKDGGFRMYPFRYQPVTSEREKKKIVDALQKALEIVQGG